MVPLLALFVIAIVAGYYFLLPLGFAFDGLQWSVIDSWLINREMMWIAVAAAAVLVFACYRYIEPRVYSR